MLTLLLIIVFVIVLLYIICTQRIRCPYCKSDDIERVSSDTYDRKFGRISHYYCNHCCHFFLFKHL